MGLARLRVTSLRVTSLRIAEIRPWQDGVVDGLEGGRNQGGADRPGRFAASQRNQLAAVSWRNRRVLHQIAHQIENVLEVVAVAKPLFNKVQHPLPLIVTQAYRTTDSQVVTGILLQRDQGDPFTQV